MHKLSVVSILVMLALASLGLFIVVSHTFSGNTAVASGVSSNAASSANSSPSNSGSLLTPNSPTSQPSSDDGPGDG
jgi:hypothetical protein